MRSTFFDESYYLRSKLTSLKANDSRYVSWSAEQMKQSIENSGKSLEEDFNENSASEGTSPNSYFNTNEYLAAKARQMNSIHKDERTDWTAEQVAEEFKKEGVSAYEYYHEKGSFETDINGNLVNPSNAFDANGYVQAKLAQLQILDSAQYGSMNAMDVVAAIKQAGMDLVSHFAYYGAKEASRDNVPMVQTVSVSDRVVNDSLRSAMGENVPGNYNAPSKAPFAVKAEDAKQVVKPQDVGGLTDTSVSPMVFNPAKPVSTPQDVSYVAPPAGIEDTNESPIECVSVTTLDASGNAITVSQYGKTVTNSDGTSNTYTLKSPCFL